MGEIESNGVESTAEVGGNLMQLNSIIEQLEY
jgi:hypothetical protein